MHIGTGMLNFQQMTKYDVFEISSMLTDASIRLADVCKALSTLSQKSVTVAENGQTTAKFGDCRTFL